MLEDRRCQDGAQTQVGVVHRQGYHQTFFQNLAGLGRGYALDLLQVSLGSVGDSLDRVVAAGDDQLDVTLGETTEAL